MNELIRHCILLVVISATLLITAQTQIGDDINGLSSGDFFGHNVSLSSDGTKVALIGNGGNNGDGRLRVFENIGDVWTLYGTDMNGENFGGLGAYSLSLSADGNTLAAGIMGGFVRVFNYDANTGFWTQKGPDITNNTSLSHFAYSIKLSFDGNIIALGTPAPPIVPEVGLTQIFQFETGSWNQVGNDINGLVSAEHSGRSVDLSSDGNIVAILNNNSVRVYEHLTGNWTLLANEIPAQGSQSPNRAVSLSTNGDILAIGEPDFTDSLIQRGRVRIFSKETGAWIQVGSDIIGEVAHYRTGWNVSLSDDGHYIAIGEIGSTSGSTDKGRTRIFENQDDSWVQIGNAIIGEASEDHSGWSVSLSSDASTLAIGAPLNNGNGSDAGHARVYDLNALLSVNDVLHTKIKLYPNPAREQFTIQLSEGIDIENIRIYNSFGQLIKTTQTNTINTSKLSAGIYYVEIIINKGKLIKKIIIL